MLRSTRAVYLASAAALLLAAPIRAQESTAPVCDQTVKPGTYRIVLKNEKLAPMVALLVLERLERCLEATFIAEGSPASGMHLVSVKDSVITARLRTAEGLATVTFRLQDNGLTGDVAEGKRIWRVEGKKTA